MRPLSKRFWEKVDIRGPDECWPWKAGKYKSGYGSISRGGRGTNTCSHIVAYELQKGLIPEGMDVLHSCDNPPCCNGRHLWVGTHCDNMHDKERKNRANHARGEAHGSAKLTEEDVKKIRVLYARGEFTYLQLGKEFNVSHTTIRHAVVGKKWKHLHATTGNTNNLKSGG
jgi:hypothetical protein